VPVSRAFWAVRGCVAACGGLISARKQPPAFQAAARCDANVARSIEQDAGAMVSFSIARSSRRFRFNAAVGVASLALFSLYVLALTQMQHSTERTYAELRSSDPDLYLSKIRQAEGFRVYLRQFTELKGYDTPKLVAPPFVIGRWALYDQPMRVDDAYVPPVCLDDVVIQDGLIRVGRPKLADYKVHYVIEGPMVLAQRDNAAPISIVPIGYGVHVNHIVITLPGSKPRYGYLCK
jgi:hypothetical protein